MSAKSHTWLRLAELDVRPPSPDEGIDGWLAEQITWADCYAYQPDVAHGPLHFYLLRLADMAGGRNLWALRFPAVAFSVASVAVCLGFGRFIGREAAAVAALILAVSPSAVWVGRMAIQESGLVFSFWF